MSLKKAMLITFVLLAILTVGAVNASDNLTVTGDGDVLDAAPDDELSEMSVDDVNINMENIDTDDSDSNFTVVSVSEKEGNIVISTGDGDDAKELYRQDLSVSDKYYTEDEKYCFGVSFDDVNSYISDNIDEKSNFYDVIIDNCLKFVFEYQDSDFIVKYYDVDYNGNIIYLNEKGITSDNFNFWLSNHEYREYGESWIVNVCPDDSVGEGSVVLNIVYGDESKVYEKAIDEAEDGNIYWKLEDLDIISEYGTYIFNVSYVNGDSQLDLITDGDFTLTQFEYSTYQGDVYINYPFDVIYVWSENGEFEAYVNGNLVKNSEEGYLGGILSDFGIDEVGEYLITIKAYNEGEFVEELTYNLNVYNETGDFTLLSPFNGVLKRDLENPILFLISSPDKIGEHVTFSINGEESDLQITDSVMNWTLNDLEITQDEGFDVKILYGDEEVSNTYFDVFIFSEYIDFEVWDEQTPLYIDNLGIIISMYPHDGASGNVYVFVNNESLMKTTVNTEREYRWDLHLLGISEVGIHNVTFKFQSDDGIEITRQYQLNVTEFKNDTFRARIIEDEEYYYLYFYSPANQRENITLTFIYWDEEGRSVEGSSYSLELNESYWNKWTLLKTMYDDKVQIEVNGTEIIVETFRYDSGNSYDVNDEGEIRPGDTVVWIDLNSTDNNYTINITSGNYTFVKVVTELGDDEVWENGVYKYSITLEDLDSFATVNDKDKIRIFLDLGGGSSLSYKWLPFSVFTLQKEDEFVKLHYFEELRIDLVKIELISDEDEEDEEDEPQSEIPQEEVKLVRITVPDSLNITETGTITMSYGDYEIVKQLSDMDYEYNYGCLGKDYYILMGDLNLTNLKNNDVVNISVISDDKVLGSRAIGIHLTDNGYDVHYFTDSITLTFYYGEIGNLEYGLDGDPDRIFELDIPEFLNITEGSVIITDENDNVIFSKSLSEFEDEYTSYDGLSTDYWISDNITEFDYSCFKENVKFTVSFAYANTTIEFAKGVRIGDRLYRINTEKDIANLYKITVSDNVLVNDSDSAIVIEATDHANRQSIGIDLGSGYFAVYVNGKKVEDLGRLVRVDDEKELELFRLHGGAEGFSKVYIDLEDLNITDNGIYNITVSHVSDSYEDGTTYYNYESKLFDKTVTLASNVKANYQNETLELLTGYGIDPVLLYLDTYYDEIDDVTGKITVYNDKGKEIFTSDIKDLSLDNNRRYLSYSNFTEDDFGQNITVVYSDGNQRSGNTTLAVQWRNVTSEDFTPAVNDNVGDYYGNFLNLNIPDLVNEGRIFVTIRFNNNHDSNISNMDVNTNFSSQGVYIFNVADIKANYGNDFALAFYDLVFYEDNGNYDVDVKFTADDVNILEIANKTVDVEFLKDVLISINKTSRYAMTLPFASVRIFEPINAYGELYIDDVLYSHKTFEKGRIIFESSKTWTPGNHTAEIKVFNSEFGSLLNSSKITFETLIQSEDVSVHVDVSIKENENASISINVPQNGNLTVVIDNGGELIFPLSEGENTVNLGQLSQGNHTLWIEYENNESNSFYNNYITITVGDDGSWLDFPERIELNGSDVIKINLGDDAEGYILIYIDGALVDNCTLVNGTADISLTQYLKGDNLYGMHNYTIEYYDMEGNLIFSRNGTFSVSYIFHDDIDKNGVPLQDAYIFIVTLPNDATGEVRITVNGKSYTEPVVNGQAIFYIYGLPMGEYDVFVEYLGDDKYPASSYHTLLNISYYGVVGDFRDAKRIISLMLPANATGSLVVYNDNRKTELASEQLVGGKAKIDLSQLPVGVYELRAVYEGDDYDVRQFTAEFKVMPEIYISQDIVIGEIGQVYVDLDNSSGHLLILIEGLSPALLEIENGKINYTFDTEGLSKGNHTVNFQYFGNSFDGNLFFDENKQTGYPMPINYNMHLLAKEPTVNITSGDDWIVIECGDATGTIEVFVNGVKAMVVEIVNGIAQIDLSQFKDGNYNITFVYNGDRMFDGFIKDMNKDVVHKVPKITAKNTNVLYTAKGKYSVTLRDENGEIVSGTKVSFIIAGKVYKTAKTNSKGVASIVIDKNPGSYKITAKALGVNVTKKVTVKHLVTLKTVKVKRSAKQLVLTATLSKVNKKYLKNKKITFKFNGKKYTAKTNKKGVAKVTVKSSVLKKLKAGKKVTYQATYLKDTVKKTVKVKK